MMIGKRLRDSGLWSRRKVRDSGWFDKDGGVSFNLDIAVAEGWLERS